MDLEKETLKIGVIGTGWIFENEHLRGYLNTKRGYIIGFFNRTKSRAESILNKYISSISRLEKKSTTLYEKAFYKKALDCKVYDNVDQLLKEADAVDICTHPDTHIHYIKKAMLQKKQILVEKPLCRTYLEGEKIFDSIDYVNNLNHPKIPFYLYTQVVYNPIFKMGKEVIEKEKIGSIKSMRCCHATLDLKHTFSKSDFSDPLKSGGGCLKDIGPHAFSVMRYWLDKEAKIDSVKAVKLENNVRYREVEGQQDIQVQVEDKAIINIDWSLLNNNNKNTSIPTILEAYWMEKKDLPKEIRLAGLYHEIQGTEGTMTFPHGTIGLLLKKKPYFGIHVFFKITRPDGTIEKISMPAPKPHSESLTLINEFCSQKKSRFNLEDAKQMMEIFDMAYYSKKEDGKKVTSEEFHNYIAQYKDKKSTTNATNAFLSKIFPI